MTGYDLTEEERREVWKNDREDLTARLELAYMEGLTVECWAGSGVISNIRREVDGFISGVKVKLEDGSKSHLIPSHRIKIHYCCDRHAMSPKDSNACAIWLNSNTYDGCEVVDE